MIDRRHAWPLLRPLGVLLALLTLLVLAAPPARAADPIDFTRATLTGAAVTFSSPTSLKFGPDGRLYVTEHNGRVRALTLNANHQITASQTVALASQLEEVFGIDFDPTDSSSPPTVYVTNTISGVGPSGPVPAGAFPGRITRISGPSYGTFTDVVTGLPASNFGHQTNGLAFDDTGVLYISQGSTTNAGIPSALFTRSEVPLSAAVLEADIHAGGFDGAVTYSPAGTYSDTVDQVSGDVTVFAAGLRNPYDLMFHSNGHLYLTDNGPNAGVGASSTSCTTQGAHPQEPDELNIIEAGDYYGHPNRNRGRFDARQCVYHAGGGATGPDWTQPIGLLPTSSNGLVEYTASSFGGKLQGDLFYVSYVAQELRRIVLGPGGTSVTSDTLIDGDFSAPLDVTMGPDGTLYVADYGSNEVVFFAPPVEPSVGGIAELSRAAVRGEPANNEPDGGGWPVEVAGLIALGLVGLTLSLLIRARLFGRR